MRYDCLDDFMSDLPALALRARDALRGHDGLFSLSVEDRVWLIRLQDGELTLPEAADDPLDCSAQTDAQTLLGVINGTVSPAKAILLRKIRVRGNLLALTGLIRLMGG